MNRVQLFLPLFFTALLFNASPCLAKTIGSIGNYSHVPVTFSQIVGDQIITERVINPLGVQEGLFWPIRWYEEPITEHNLGQIDGIEIAWDRPSEDMDIPARHYLCKLIAGNYIAPNGDSYLGYLIVNPNNPNGVLELNHLYDQDEAYALGALERDGKMGFASWLDGYL